MSDQEIKPAFTLKYIALTLITTLLVSLVSVIVSKYTDSRPSRELHVFTMPGLGLIGDSKLPRDQIEAIYYLKSNPKREIRSLFRKAFLIQNAGTEGVENVRMTATIKEPNVFLISNPRISTEPPEILNAISVKKDEASTQSNHIWTVSLLNPKESIIFDYIVYSEEEHNEVLMTFLPRKKNWTVINKDILSKPEPEFLRVVVIIVTSGLVISLPFILIILVAVPFYLKKWKNRPDYRNQYGSFFSFYMNHPPW